MNKKITLIGMNQDELGEYCSSNNFPKFHGEQLFRWIYKNNHLDLNKMTNIPEKLKEKINNQKDKFYSEVGKVIVGQEEVIEHIFIALLCRGHILLEGVPGLGKTLIIKTISKILELNFNRIQFTPDLMPSDITGTEIISQNADTGNRELKFIKGPVFSNIVLADEINRTPPKTQSALLEAMQEKSLLF